MDANTLLWIGQILLALAFATAGVGHAIAYDRMATNPQSAWVIAVGRQNMRIIGSLEILGAVGLTLPTAIGNLPWLTPVSALAFSVLMLAAIVFHARRPGEVPNIVLNSVLGVLALAVAYGRFVGEPLSAQTAHRPALRPVWTRIPCETLRTEA